MTSTKLLRSGWGPIILAVVVLSAIRIAFAGLSGLVDDEAYYATWALNPALSYYDHPPMVAWLITPWILLFDVNSLSVRAPAILISLIGLLVVARTAFLLFSEEIAQRTIWFFLAMPMIAVGSIIMTPDVPSVLFSGLTLWALAELNRSHNANWWLLVGVFAGLGFLSKYTNLFLGISILLWLFARDNRKWFASAQLWLGGFIAALISSPVLIWNYQNNWVSFYKQFGRMSTAEKFGLSYFGEFIGGLFVLSGVLIFLLALYGFYLIVRDLAKNFNNQKWLLSASLIPLVLYFFYHSMFGRVQQNWLAPIYPQLAMFAAYAVSQILDEAKKRKTQMFATGLGFVMIAGIFTHAFSPIIRLRNDPTSQMHGWTDFSASVNKLRLEQGAEWIATSSFATTAQLAIASHKKASVYQLNERLRYLHAPAPSALVQTQKALYVELDRRARQEVLTKQYSTVEELPPLLRHSTLVAPIKYRVFLLSNPRGNPFTAR